MAAADQVRSTSADVLTSLPAIATVTATSSAFGVCGGDCAGDEDADGICDGEDGGYRRLRRVRRQQSG